MTEVIRLHVNGREECLQIEPDVPLLYALRNDLGLKGAKYGCGLEQCGACKVLVDGEALASCTLPVGKVQGRRIRTVEGLSQGEDLHPVQRAFLAEGAAQCGYCTAGLVVAAVALLERDPHPTEAQIRAALDIHLCRCGAYSRVLRAVRRAAGEMGP